MKWSGMTGGQTFSEQSGMVEVSSGCCESQEMGHWWGEPLQREQGRCQGGGAVSAEHRAQGGGLGRWKREVLGRRTAFEE